MKRTAWLIGAAVGAVLFAYAVRQAGPSEIIDGIHRVGWGALAVLAIGGVRFALRAQAWRLCAPASSPLTFRRAFAAFLAGDAVGSVTPLGLLASEPTKVLLTRHHLATREAVSSLALENLVYAVSVLAMAALGAIVLLRTAVLPAGLRTVVVAALAAAAIGLATLLVILRYGAGGSLPRAAWRTRLSSLRQELTQVPVATLATIFGLDALYHGLAVLEVFLTLTLLIPEHGPTIGQSIVFEALNRILTVVFKFVPFRIGVDEAFTGALAPLLSIATTAGVTLAIVRKLRNLFWAGLGLVVLGKFSSQTAGARLP